MIIDYEKLNKLFIKPKSKVRLKSMGNVSEIMYSDTWGGKATIKKLDRDTYITLSTGEIGLFNHSENRAESEKSLRNTMRELRDTINANVIETDNCKFITLTYAENMTDTKILYEDYKKFIKRMRYSFGHFEYISVVEPQGRGAWHCHVIAIFDKKAPYIPWQDIRDIWGHGSIQVNKIDDVDNVGAYLTAYLCDVELEKAKEENIDLSGKELKEIEYTDLQGVKQSKKFVKGARLCLYPPGMQLYRRSKGIKKAEIEYTTYSEAKKRVGAVTPTFSKSFKLSDGDKLNKTLSYEYYNSKRKPNKDQPK